MELHRRYLAGRVAEIERELDYLETVLAETDKKILRNPHYLAGLKYSVLLITEAIGSILQHILARQYKIAVSGLAETMFRAGQVGVVPPDMARRFEALARFRNRLVHRYWTVDDRTFLRNLRNGFAEFQAFVSLMRERFLLNRTEKNPEKDFSDPPEFDPPELD